MQQIHWIEINPVDTLFFRGTEAMIAGENHETDTMFPPMPATLTGAIRSAILGQKKILPVEYLNNSSKWTKDFPLLGSPEKAGFTIVGPLFRIGETTLYPAPAHWMADMSNAIDGRTIRVQASQPFADKGLGLTGSTPSPFWVFEPDTSEMKSLSGYWVTNRCFKEMASGYGSFVLRASGDTPTSDEATLFSANDLYHREERVGIALTEKRTTKEGHLYASVHVRLSDGVCLLIGVQSMYSFCLASQGVLQLGGEQRMCSYSLTGNPDLPGNTAGKLLFALSPLSADLPKELQNQPRSSGKLLRIGGWDMKKQFHKPLRTWFPAGTVIQKNETDTALPECISI